MSKMTQKYISMLVLWLIGVFIFTLLSNHSLLYGLNKEKELDLKELSSNEIAIVIEEIKNIDEPVVAIRNINGVLTEQFGENFWIKAQGELNEFTKLLINYIKDQDFIKIRASEETTLANSHFDNNRMLNEFDDDENCNLFSTLSESNIVIKGLASKIRGEYFIQFKVIDLRYDGNPVIIGKYGTTLKELNIEEFRKLVPSIVSNLLNYYDEKRNGEARGKIFIEAFDENSEKVPGVEIYFNNNTQGVSPFFIDNIKNGNYNITIKSKYFTENRNLVVYNDKVVNLKIKMNTQKELTQSKEVSSNPKDYISTNEKGNALLNIGNLSYGVHVLSKDQSWIYKHYLEKENQRFMMKIGLYSSISIAIASGVYTTVMLFNHSKQLNELNDLLSKYRNSSVQADMDNYYNLAKSKQEEVTKTSTKINVGIALFSVFTISSIVFGYLMPSDYEMNNYKAYYKSINFHVDTDKNQNMKPSVDISFRF